MQNNILSKKVWQKNRIWRDREARAMRELRRLSRVHTVVPEKEHSGLIAGYSIIIAAGLIAVTIFFSSCDIANAMTPAQVVASVIAAESCGEGARGMAAVASTIANRARLRHQSPLAVVMAKNQYFGATARNRDTLYRQCRTVADKLAAQVIAGTLPDTTGGAEFFLLAGERRGAWIGDFTVKIGKHYFYKTKERK